MEPTLHPLPKGTVKLLPGLFEHRFSLNRQYMISLKTESLLQNFYLEAGLWNPRHRSEGYPWGLGSAHLPTARTLPRALALGGGDDFCQHW